jgi:alpha-1,6-mannosyltransferase
MFWNPSGGVHRYLCAKRRWLRQNTDWRHTVASPMQDEVSTLRLPSLPLPGSRGDYRFPWARRRLAQMLRDSRPSVIESADPYRLAWAVLDAARELGVGSVAFCHSNLAQMARLGAGPLLGSPASAAARRYAVRLYRQFDLVLAPSRAMVAHLRDWGVASAVHQPLGVDTGVFHPTRRSAAWRASLGLPPSARLLVYVGRFAPEKHLSTLVDTVNLLDARHWLIALGSGPTPPSGPRVRVLPPCRNAIDVATALASCDVFVHAGRQETFGLSALEALACGLPVVAQGCEGLAELVDDRVGQRVMKTGARDFADAITDVFESDRDALTVAARQRAEESDWSRVLPQLRARYERLMRGERQGEVCDVA